MSQPDVAHMVQSRLSDEYRIVKTYGVEEGSDSYLFVIGPARVNWEDGLCLSAVGVDAEDADIWVQYATVEGGSVSLLGDRVRSGVYIHTSLDAAVREAEYLIPTPLS